ncbi:Type IIS restriction enzyme Eco57I [termite gut metagenome]|uniref:site-specific DNA-methyltransferase (adenine-specific) n=1 Tax=termite gut metagenome TaxID=433724 RepID=A0A5J4S3T7_9ZZZZ
MKEKELKNRLQQTFQLDIWKEILPFFFKKVDYFTRPENLFSENEKVIEGKQIGTIKLDDGKQLAIFVVEVEDNISILRNRVGLREIAAKHIDQAIIHGTLAFFYNKNQADYRFSFIFKESNLDMETGELIKDETKPKRYTFLLGSNETCTTPAKRLLLLADKKENDEITLKQLKEVFSVEALNKDFFKSYKAQYEKFWKYLAAEENSFRTQLIDQGKDTKEKQEKPIRDFVKKLLGRIIFLYFLQKKGWMGCPSDSSEYVDGDLNFMQNLFQSFSKKEKFHSKCLTELFFKTLNTKRSKDIFKVEGLKGNLNGSKVPYLNGGLFEPEKNPITLQIDFPVDYFSELLDFFNQYNFTIDENNPDDHEVGIDPEMLGHIFENLLEENREKGAFYTPKEIVQYMCKESLIQYLLNIFSENKEDIEQFIRTSTVTDFFKQKDNAILLNQKLDDIKVCDPAIGSGAFPIGMLQEIFEAKRFIYPRLQTHDLFDPAKVKKNIIQNSIYGVDFEKGAVDIAQLRFWLALVVEEQAPSPLPNLDYKIMQGDSLLEEFGGLKLQKLMEEEDFIIVSEQLTLGHEFERINKQLTVFDKVTKQQLSVLIDKFYDPIAWEKKTGERIDKVIIKNTINDIIEGKIHAYILSEKKELEKNVLDKQKIWNIQNEDYSRLNQKSGDFKKFVKMREKLQNLNNLENRLISLQNSDEKTFFLWHTWYKDVFDKGGFDVIIGNPPYIQIAKVKDDIEKLQQAEFETFTRTGDIYCLFYEKGIELLKPQGTLSYITSNTWMRTKFGENLRRYFTTKCNPIILLNFEDTQIFPSAAVEVSILVAKSDNWNKNVKAVAIKGNYNIGTSINDYLNKNGIILSDLSTEEWAIGNQLEIFIKTRIANIGKRLSQLDVNIFRGVTTGFNDAFFIDENIKEYLVNQDSKSKQLIKPLIRGRGLNKYYTIPPNQYIIFTKRGTNIEEFPSIKSHLLQYYDQLQPKQRHENRIGRKPGDYKWFEIQDNTAYYKEFEKEKLLWIQLSDKNRFSFSDKELFATNSCFMLTLNDSSEISLHYLSAILNSRLILYFFKMIGSTSGMGVLEWTKVATEKIPVAITNKPTCIKIENVVLCIIESIKLEMEVVISCFEDIINMMVCELYFEEELKSKEINVLQFINFPDISKVDKPEDKKAIIQKVYYELQEKDNPIRNRLLVASNRSEIIACINASTN